MFFWPPVSIPFPNYEVVEFQPQAVDILDLGSVHPPVHFRSPLCRIFIPVTRRYEQMTDNGHMEGHQSGLRGAPIT